jgi:methionine sulfoxide reductase heme-binding subunit
VPQGRPDGLRGKHSERGGRGNPGPVVRLARERAGAAGRAQRGDRAGRGDPHGLGHAARATVRVGGAAPDAGAVLSVAFLALHVATAILDPYVSIGWAATVLPFTSGYRALAVGLGTLAVDLGGTVLLTSLVRGRLRYRAWRAVHWLAYLAWPAAFAHSLTAGNDLGTWWVAMIVLCCAAAAATAVLARLIYAGQHRPGASRRTGPARRLPVSETTWP